MGARPFLKWAGGKQQLLSQYEPHFPSRFDRYVEPFAGGAAVFFHLRETGRLPGEVLFFDNNPELINVYRVVRDHLDPLLALLARHQERHSREHYYRVRSLDRQDRPLGPVEQAARTLYLNRTCYNGLYRVNRQGHFNVPMGRYENPRILDEARLRAASAALQRVQLDVRDFRTLVEVAQPGDFLYFDPPYDPVSKTASFTAYTAHSFGDPDQRDLAAVFARLAQRGCLCMLSNSDTPFIRELYRGYHVHALRAGRSISRDAAGRGPVGEVLVLNYEPGEAVPQDGGGMPRRYHHSVDRC